jgi:ubiquinone/menaquinone biosynthesis C-methylase UbiE
MVEDKIEILSVGLLITERRLVNQMRGVSDKLGLAPGWHYMLDLPWAARNLDLSPRMLVLDAGAGTGLMQWWLADREADVISVDRTSRYHLSTRFRQRYRIRGWRLTDLGSNYQATARDWLPARSPRFWSLYPQKLKTASRHWSWKSNIAAGCGTVYIYNHDLTSLPDIPDESVDAVVSISALEHNTSEGLRACVDELTRVLKPGGKMIVTLAAARAQDWFHEPSKGWCLSEATLRDVFNLAPGCSSNYGQYDELFYKLQNSTELRDNLDPSYFRSGDNGMPWGVWAPEYQPVGVIKVKKQG